MRHIKRNLTATKNLEAIANNTLELLPSACISLELCVYLNKSRNLSWKCQVRDLI